MPVPLKEALRVSQLRQEGSGFKAGMQHAQCIRLVGMLRKELPNIEALTRCALLLLSPNRRALQLDDSALQLFARLNQSTRERAEHCVASVAQQEKRDLGGEENQWLPVGWQPGEPVWRLEFEFKRDFLKERQPSYSAKSRAQLEYQVFKLIASLSPTEVDR